MRSFDVRIVACWQCRSWRLEVVRDGWWTGGGVRQRHPCRVGLGVLRALGYCRTMLPGCGESLAWCVCVLVIDHIDEWRSLHEE